MPALRLCLFMLVTEKYKHSVSRPTCEVLCERQHVDYLLTHSTLWDNCNCDFDILRVCFSFYLYVQQNGSITSNYSKKSFSEMCAVSGLSERYCVIFPSLGPPSLCPLNVFSMCLNEFPFQCLNTSFQQ